MTSSLKLWLLFDIATDKISKFEFVYLCSVKRIAFHTFGCKLNFAETSSISRNLDPLSFEITDFRKEADVYVVHSCMVTAAAERKTIGAIRQAHRRNPSAAIIVIGCMAELQKEGLFNEAGVQAVIGNEQKFDLEKILSGVSEKPEDQKPFTFRPSWSVHERTRSFLKIQDGCDYFCAYCTIPLARGRSRSGTIAEILQAARTITEAGAKEIVLTGVNIGDFGRHHHESLYPLLVQLHHIEGLERIRISSIEPDLLNADIIRLAADQGKLLPHFHIPLQSGSDRVLELMKRRYKTALFAEKVDLIKSILPEACIATDVITGFPGESEEDHLNSCHFIQNIPLSYMHVFTYSERRNTLALKRSDIVPLTIRKERSMALHQLSEAKKKVFYEGNANAQRTAFFESANKKGFIFGFTENYIRVRHPWNQRLINKILPVRLTDFATSDYFDVELI